MTIPDPLDQKDLDLVAAFAVGMLDKVDANRAQQLIANNARFADEHAAQLLAISALGGNNWYQPLDDLEKARIRNSVVPKPATKKQIWSIRVLKPLSIAAAAVVIVGFAGMTLFGGGQEASFDVASTRLSNTISQSAATEAPAMEAPAAADGIAEASDDASAVTEEGALAPKFGFPIAPPKGELEPFLAGEPGSLEEFLDFQQWTEPVGLSRYANLECWPDAESFTEVLGVSLSTIEGIDYEIVRTTKTVEVRATGTCEATVLP